MNRKSCRAGKQAIVLVAAALLSGCAGPSTRVLPQRQGGTMQEVPDEIPIVEEVNSFYLQESLGILSASPRPAGSRGEDSAARYIQKLLQDYGYTVNRQRFREKTEHEEIIGTNVTAVREAEDPDADILLICTWHDSLPDSPGAGKNASGVSVFLETARILSGLPTDTEIRFVSLSAHEKDGLGARMYAKGLSKRERERLIGVITIGPCGAVDTQGTVLTTQDGKRTMLGELVREAAGTVTGLQWDYGTQAGQENGIFASYGIPAVQIGQRYDSFDFGTPLDTVETVDVECLSEIVDTVCQSVSGIMSLDTPSMRAKAHFENNWKNFIYSQEPGQKIPFGVSPGRLQASLGIPGRLAVVNRDPQNRPVEKYQFSMKWFDLDQPFQSSYYFTDEQLDLVSLVPAGNGLTANKMQEQLSRLYGEPDKKDQGPYGLDCIWLDAQTGTQIELIPGKEDFEIEIRSYTPQSRLIARFSPDGTLQDGALQDGTQADGTQPDGGQPRQPGLESLKDLCGILFWQPEGTHPAAELVFESDGEGGKIISVEKKTSGEHPAAQAGVSSQQGQARHEEGEASAVWEIHIDPADFLPAAGQTEDRTWTLKTLDRTYGELLSQAEPEHYAAGYEQLLQDIRERTAEIPGAAPGSGITRVQNTLPEFADAFALYILAEMPPESPGDYQECVRYFDQFGELNTYRRTVRAALGLQTEE